jgi:tetratricopeptide (TPR) repeat protein
MPASRATLARPNAGGEDMRGAWIIALFLCAGALSAVAQTPDDKSRKPADLVSEAREELAAGDSYAAISLLDRALAAKEIAPADRAKALFFRGAALYEEDNVLAALSDLRAAIAEPSLPEDLRQSATANVIILARAAGSYSGVVGGMGYSYNTLMSLEDLAEMERALDGPDSRRLDADERSDRLGELAHEYASRGAWTKAKQFAARALSEARGSTSPFTVGSALMSYYELAEMQDDHAAAVAYLDQATAQFEKNAVLPTVPGMLLEAIRKSDSRRDHAETCRHRSNLDRIYRKIANPGLEADAGRNAAEMQRGKCPAA